jgi:hypothetical protein
LNFLLFSSFFYHTNIFFFFSFSLSCLRLRDPEAIKELMTLSLGMPHVHSDEEADEENPIERLSRFDVIK